ncbi:MAG: hypothetical protein U0R44_00945 [Candidatus Micrarchaeia archaeon]
MVRSGLDIRRTLLASVLVIGIGVVLVIIGMILQLLSIVVKDGNGAIVETVLTVFSVLSIPLFFLLYLWAGIRAAKRYNFDAVGAATVAALSYLVTAFIQLFLDIILSVVVVSRGVVGSGFGSAEAAVTASVFGSAVGLSGIGLSAVCGIGIIILGTMINFVIGGFGALFALRKSESA